MLLNTHVKGERNRPSTGETGFRLARPAPAARASARRQTSSARPAGPRARADGKNTRAASAVKRHQVGSAPCATGWAWRPEHRRRRRHGDGRSCAISPGRSPFWRCVLLRSLCGAGRQGGCSRPAAFALTPSLPARAQGHGGTSVSPSGVVVDVEEGKSTLRRCPARVQSTHGACTF